MEKQYRYYIDEKYYTVEDYIGLYKKAIVKKYDYNYLFLGSGDKVIDQSPAKGTKIKQGGTIILYLG